MSIRSFCLVLAAVALVGCASSLNSERTRLQAIAVCCEKVSDIPMSNSLKTQVEFNISNDSPVFHFPSGRSPFVALVVPETMRGREFVLRSFVVPFTLRGRAHGFFAPTLMYLDSERKVISTFYDAKPRGEDAHGRGVFWSMIAIPPTAAYVVIYTSAAQLGEQQTSLVAAPSYLVPMSGTYVTQGGRMSPLRGYHSSTGSLMLSEVKK